jgi:hypothetical protein
MLEIISTSFLAIKVKIKVAICSPLIINLASFSEFDLLISPFSTNIIPRVEAHFGRKLSSGFHFSLQVLPEIMSRGKPTRLKKNIFAS